MKRRRLHRSSQNQAAAMPAHGPPEAPRPYRGGAQRLRPRPGGGPPLRPKAPARAPDRGGRRRGRAAPAAPCPRMRLQPPWQSRHGWHSSDREHQAPRAGGRRGHSRRGVATDAGRGVASRARARRDRHRSAQRMPRACAPCRCPRSARARARQGARPAAR